MNDFCTGERHPMTSCQRLLAGLVNGVPTFWTVKISLGAPTFWTVTTKKAPAFYAVTVGPPLLVTIKWEMNNCSNCSANKMRKIISINLFISILLLSLVFSLNSNLPNKFNVKNIVNYQHNYFTNFNRLDFRHWGIPLFSNKNEVNGEIIYNAIYLSSNQKKISRSFSI